MQKNQSPWIHQLNRTRDVNPLTNSISTEILIVGGGIAGITTAYFLLKNTNKRVTLIDADKIAHGATGHNAGQITPYFERPLHDIIREFGEKLGIQAQESIEAGWVTLEEIYAETKIQTPYYRFTGYDALSSKEQVINELKNNKHRANGNLRVESIFISSEADFLGDLDEKYKDLYKVIEKKDLLELLETNNSEYICAVSYQKGCMNSAIFCEELLGFLLSKFPNKFEVFEGSPMRLINLKEDGCVSSVLGHSIVSERVILCTNGFENFNIINEAGEQFDSKFHHYITGRIGYMAGYVEPLNDQPIAISYFPKEKTKSGDPTGEPYFLLTRRPHEHESGNSHNLICAGGPEVVLPNHASYSKDEVYSDLRKLEIEELLRDNYKKYSEETEYEFLWHGLMGYTPNGIRLIGEEPVNPLLMYNLGCNGIGILPSIYGAQRISKIINNEKVDDSIFDPKHSSLN